MATWTLDPTFYVSPAHAMTAPPAEIAYGAMLDPSAQQPDALAVLDVKRRSAGYATEVGRRTLPVAGAGRVREAWPADLAPRLAQPRLSVARWSDLDPLAGPTVGRSPSDGTWSAGA